MPMFLEILFSMHFIWRFQEKYSLKINPRNLMEDTGFISGSLITNQGILIKVKLSSHRLTLFMKQLMFCFTFI